jgi:hypothetical protein
VIVSTVKKSHAMMLCAWPRMKSRHESAPRSPGRSDPGAHQDVADARLGDLDAEPDELTRDPPVSPSRVLASEP